MNTLLLDLRYGMRLLAKRPGFTAVAVLTLALGIGANSAIFSVVNAVLLRPLPFREPDQLIRIWETFYPSGWGSVSVPNLKDWREQNEVFAGLAAFQTSSFVLQRGESPERISAATVSADFFDVLGVPAQSGRSFTDGEDQPGRHQVVVLSDQLWKRSFGADPGLIGQSLILSGEKYTVIGIMPPGFRYPSRLTELWVPLVPQGNQASNRGNHWLQVLGRLKSGVTIDQAREQMVSIAGRLEHEYPDAQARRSVRLLPLQEETVRSVRPALLLMLGAVAFVLLIACTNVANLLLARATGRGREIAIRSALGAGRGTLIRQFLTESVLLSALGGIVGLLLAKLGLDALVALAANSLPRANEVALDGKVLGFTLLLSMVTGVVFGLAPAIQASKTDVQTALKEGGSAGGGFERSWLRGLLVVTEVGAALVLLVGAGLLIRSFERLQDTESGLRPENVLTLSLVLPTAKYDTPQTIISFYQQLLTRISTLPGVQSCGAINMLPLQQWGTNGPIEIEGEPPYPAGQAPIAEYRAASPDYFRVLGIPLIAGRFFNDQDRESAFVTIIINQTLADRHFPNRDPIGKRLKAGSPDYVTIIGVVGDVKQSGLTQASRPELFWCSWQAPRSGMSLVVRAASEPTALTSAVRGEVQALDRDLPIHNVKTMGTVIEESIADRRLNMLLLGIFASVALILAVIGIYSVMSYTTTQSTREIGIRMALGARPADVLKLIIGKGALLSLIGVALGMAASFGLTRLMETLLYGVTATDPLTFASVAVLLIGVSLVACYVPARRAIKIDPMVALRYE
jgi:putative ABC transport system permease protein